MPTIALVAGELSGDRLGAELIEALRHRRDDLRFVGIAGPGMVAAGCEAWVESDELSVMGLTEVLAHLPRLRRVFLDLERRLLADPPDVYVGIDAPDFNLRMARRLRRAGIPTVQYVSPTVWAWRQSRVAAIRAACDRVLCLLPFEESFLESHGVRARFVGHPLADRLAPDDRREAARQALGLPAEGPVVAILPGSRRAEMQRLGPVFAATAARLAESLPGLHFVSPAATPALREEFRRRLGECAPRARVLVVDGRAHEAMQAADVVLLASGTATLEGTLLARPMIVAYRVAPLTWLLLRHLGLVKVETVALPNLLAGEPVVPEYLQSAAVPERLAPAVLELLGSEKLRADQRGRLRELGAQLRRDASARAADEVLAVLAGR